MNTFKKVYLFIMAIAVMVFVLIGVCALANAMIGMPGLVLALVFGFPAIFAFAIALSEKLD